MSKECPVVVIGSGEDAITVNESDYENGFPLNEEARKTIDKLDNKKKPKK